jgi:hypothetical protein
MVPVLDQTRVRGDAAPASAVDAMAITEMASARTMAHDCAVFIWATPL